MGSETSTVQMRRALDAKEALLSRLRTMNDEVDAGLHKDETSPLTIAFRKAYAQVVDDLHVVSHNIVQGSCSSQQVLRFPKSGTRPIKLINISLLYLQWMAKQMTIFLFRGVLNTV